MTKHDDTTYLNHIVDSIVKIERYTENYSFDQFKSDDKTIDSVVRNFEIIGEAGNKVSDGFKEDNRSIDFRAVISFRNRLAHGYDDIDLETVWDTIKTDLPSLKKQIEDCL